MSDEKPPRQVKLRVNCAGYQGEPVSVFAAYDLDHDVLVIVDERAYEVGDRPGFVRMTNREKDAHHDMVYGEDQIDLAVEAFFEMQAMRLIKFAGGNERLNPHHKIDREGLTMSGQKYRFSPDITNGQVASLFAALGARAQAGAAATQDFMSMLTI